MRKGMIGAAVVLALGGSVGRADAQPLERSTRIAVDAYVTAMAADWVTTQAVLSNGGRESDPLARPFVGHGVARSIAGAAVDATLTVLAVRLARTHRKVGRVAAWVAAGTRTAIVISNGRAVQR